MATKAKKSTAAPTQSRASSTAVFDEIQRLSEAIVNGKLDERAKVDQFDGQDKVMLQGVNDLIDALVDPISVTAEYVGRISKGDIPVNEATTMEKAAAAGELDTRADVSQYNGAWANIVQGLNNTMEGIVVPLRDVGGVLDKLAAGDSKARVEADYKGDYDVLKVACNALGERGDGKACCCRC